MRGEGEGGRAVNIPASPRRSSSPACHLPVSVTISATLCSFMQFSRLISSNVTRPQSIGHYIWPTPIVQFWPYAKPTPHHFQLPLPLPVAICNLCSACCSPSTPFYLPLSSCLSVCPLVCLSACLSACLSLCPHFSSSCPTVYPHVPFVPLCSCVRLAAKIQLPHALLHNACESECECV